MVVLCSFLPAFLFRPLGGVLADRFNRTLLMLAGNIGSAIGIGVTFLLLDRSASNLVFIYPGIMSAQFSLLAKILLIKHPSQIFFQKSFIRKRVDYYSYQTRASF